MNEEMHRERRREMKESATLEFKSDITNTFLKTVSAYSNYGEGRILFGVDDDGRIVGVKDVKQACLDIENKINDSISPRPDYSLDVDADTNVITLLIKEGKHKPYLYKSKAYKRNDTASVEVDYLEFTELVLKGQNLTFDDISSANQNLEFSYLEKKLQETIGIDSLTNDILRTLGLYTSERHYNNAAALLADKNDFRGIDIARFGESISYILDRRTLANISVLSQYDQAVEIYRQYYQYEVIDEIKRKTVENVPERAFREPVANAIVHRKWNVDAHIRIEMYSDRIEIFSPGGLPAGVTVDDYVNGRVSILRNPILGGVFFRMHYIEQFGTGIRRIKEAYQDNSRKPVFDISENVIHVILPVLGHSDLSEDQKKIYELMKMGREISSSMAAQETGFSKSKATTILKDLVAGGYVKVIGKGRGTKYAKK